MSEANEQPIVINVTIGADGAQGTPAPRIADDSNYVAPGMATTTERAKKQDCLCQCGSSSGSGSGG